MPPASFSKEEPACPHKILYLRLFGKGPGNIYGFKSADFEEIEESLTSSTARKDYLTFHSLRMNDAAERFVKHLSMTPPRAEIRPLM